MWAGRSHRWARPIELRVRTVVKRSSFFQQRPQSIEGQSIQGGVPPPIPESANRSSRQKQGRLRAMKLTVNGQERILERVDPDMPLLWVIRDLLGLKGTKFGCGKALCGACTVHLDGQPVRSCQTFLADVGDSKVTTIEAISGPVAEAVKAAWITNNVPQCGYCQPGQIMSAVALLESTPNPSRDDVNSAMSGNICRCGTYPRIRAAIADASKHLGQ